jgi:hypothetical protein
MNKLSILGIARHLLTFGGGIAVAKGIVDEGIVTELVGAVITILGFILSFIAPEKK